MALGAIFWLFNGAFGILAPFTTLYYARLGISGWRLGLLTAIPAITALLTGPLWGSIADSRSAHRLVLRGALCLNGLFSLAVGFAHGYRAVALAVALMSFAGVPIGSLIDTMAVNHAARGGASYGSLRVHGSIGFIVVVLVMSRVIGDEVSNILYFIYPIPLAMTLLATLPLPPIGERVSHSLWSGLGVVIRIPEYVLLVFTSFMLNIAMTAYGVYLGLHILAAGGAPGITGQVMAIGAITELPFIAFGGWLLQRLGSRRMITLAIIAFCIRYGIVAIFPGTAPVLVSALFQGASYGVFLVASITLASRLAPANHQATAQAVMATMSYGLGSIIGSFGGGLIESASDTTALFRVITGLCVATLVVFVIGDRSRRAPA